MAVHIAKVHDVLNGEKTYGTTILVDRLWPRGVSKDDLKPDEWLKDAAPSSELRKWFDHDADKFEEFSKRYRSELDEKAAEEDVEKLIDAATNGAVTLLYAAADRKHNHAIVLADWLKD